MVIRSLEYEQKSLLHIIAYILSYLSLPSLTEAVGIILSILAWKVEMKEHDKVYWVFWMHSSGLFEFVVPSSSRFDKELKFFQPPSDVYSKYGDDNYWIRTYCCILSLKIFQSCLEKAFLRMHKIFFKFTPILGATQFPPMICKIWKG